MEAVQEAINRYGTPEVFNTDQGSQFTSIEFTGLLKQNGIAITWMAKAAGGITCLWSDYGRASNTKKCICMLTIASARPRED